MAKLPVAPILEYDIDSSQKAKEYFFSIGKKDFGNFKQVQDLNIKKCLIFFPRSFEKLEKIYKKCELVYEFKSASTFSPVYLYDKKVLIALCPLGGPAAANLMEELGFVGIKAFIACGSCGCIDPHFDLETLIIPKSAIRDEGVSYHYLPAEREVDTSTRINNALERVLIKEKVKYIKGKTWTTDAIYRETPSRVARRLKEGATCVEMECASLSAVAEFNCYQFSCLLYCSDKIGSTEWDWRVYDKYQLREKLVKICINALLLADV